MSELKKGFFTRHGLQVEIEFTESSDNQIKALANGKADIVYSAVDNAVAMVEVAKKDVTIVSGGDSGTNEFYVQDYVKDFSDIRGHAVAVDQTNTAYALQAKKILLENGLKPSDYKLNPVGNGALRLKSMVQDKNNAAAILNLPYSLQAEAAGMKSMGRTTDLLVKPLRPSRCVHGPMLTQTHLRNTLRPSWNRCAGRSTQKTGQKPSPS